MQKNKARFNLLGPQWYQNEIIEQQFLDKEQIPKTE